MFRHRRRVGRWRHRSAGMGIPRSPPGRSPNAQGRSPIWPESSQEAVLSPSDVGPTSIVPQNTDESQSSWKGWIFAHVDKRSDPGRGSARFDPRDDLERKLAGAQGGHHEAPPFIGRVRLVVAPAAQRNQQIQVEVGAALGALEHVVDV